MKINWISKYEKLPPISGELKYKCSDMVLVCDAWGAIASAWYQYGGTKYAKGWYGEGVFTQDEPILNVTHWAIMPNKPQED